MSLYCFKIHCKGEEKEEIIIEQDSEDLISEPLKKFAEDKNRHLEDFEFYFNSSLIEYQGPIKIKDSIFNSSPDQTIEILAIPKPPSVQKGNQSEIQNQMDIEIKEEENDNEDFQEPKGRKKVNRTYYNDIICPKCKTSAIIDKNKGELNLNILNCENFHYLNNIKYDQYDNYVFNFDDKSEENCKKLQGNIDLLFCDLCSNHKIYMTPPMDILYICSCGSKVCSVCYKDHNEPGHYKVNLEDKNYFCIKHAKKFDFYCFDCNANFCEKCENLHKEHETEKFSKIKPKREYVKELEKITKNQKEKLRGFKASIKKLFNDMIKTIDSYLNSYIMIENTLIRRFNTSFLNYQLIRNLKNKKLFENDIFNKLENFDKIEEINKKFISLFNDIYRPINDAKLKSEKKKPLYKLTNINNNKIKIIYNIGEKKFDRRVKLFDPVFVENNKDKLSLIVDGKKQQELSVYYLNVMDKNKITVELEGIRDLNNRHSNSSVTDMSYMFNNCKYLQDVDFRNWKTDNIVSMEAMFQLCDLEKIPDISFFNTSNLENIRALFCKCTKLREIPNMNRWFNNKESKLSNISMLFNGCKSLTNINLPKYWYTTKLEDMSYMFNRCVNLREIHNLKSLQTNNVKNMCGLFNGCEKLNVVRVDFRTPNVEDMSIMFQGCRSLEKIHIRFSDTQKLRNLSGMFSGCTKLKAINIGIYSTDNVTNMTGLFRGCTNLEALPDLRKWNMLKAEKADGLFYGCKKLRTVPKWLPLWRFKKGTNYDKILENCSLDNNEIKNAWKNNEQRDEIEF